jgi:asparaginyl-tRNA synthetase
MEKEQTVEQLKAQLAKITAEKDALKEELAKVRASNFSDWGLRQRTALSSLFNRPDRGSGLVGSTIGVAGWIKSVRFGGKNSFAFVMLNDGSSWYDLQIIVDKATPGFSFIEEHKATLAASVYVIGKVVASTGKEQKIEMQALELRLLGPSDENFPVSKKQHTLEFLRGVGQFRARTTVIGSVTKIRNSLAYATHMYFQNNGFLYINTPIITASDCEGAGEMFQITTLLKDNKDDPSKLHKLPNGKVDYSHDFFKKPAFLTVSGQLNAEIYACALGSVYTFGPTFRAEDSNTARHLAEFWMIEPEIAFADLLENQNVAEQYIKFVLRYVIEKHPNELEFLEEYEQNILEERAKASAPEQQKEQKGKKTKQVKDIRGFRLQKLRERLNHVVTSDFARITYTEAIKTLQGTDHPFEKKVEWGIDLGSEHERWLAEEHFKRPVIVRDYPREIKAFYMRLNDDQKTVAAMDVLVPGVGELIGGSQREDRLDILVERIKKAGLDVEQYSWYLDLRRYGSVPHSGFGLGFERLVCYTTGMENIREAIPFPRWPAHADF